MFSGETFQSMQVKLLLCRVDPLQLDLNRRTCKNEKIRHKLQCLLYYCDVRPWAAGCFSSGTESPLCASFPALAVFQLPFFSHLHISFFVVAVAPSAPLLNSSNLKSIQAKRDKAAIEVNQMCGWNFDSLQYIHYSQKGSDIGLSGKISWLT